MHAKSRSVIPALPVAGPGVSATVAPSHRVRLAARGPGPMDAGCGSSTRGHWDGPVTCNKSHGIAARDATGRKAPCEHDASPMLPLARALAVL